MKYILGLAVLMLSLIGGTGSAFAIFAVPTATPVAGAGAVDLTEQGTYQSTTPGTPFAGSNFVIDMTLPAEVSVIPDPFGGFIIDATGAYTDNGVTTPFTDQMELVSVSSDYVEFNATNFLTSGDFFSSLMYLTSPVLSIDSTAADGTDLISFLPGSYIESTLPSDLSAASYSSGDPPITGGGVTITPAAVPEPSSLALLGSALLGFGAIRARRGRRVEMRQC
jgi:PEP-CTERM motif-containing protein